MDNVEYTLCTTDEHVLKATSVLASSKYVFLDCEGRDLGNKEGALSLIQLGAPNAHSLDIFLFDVLSLSHLALQRLFNTILASDSVRKIVWDGRMDDTELYFGHSCALQNVLDLQLVDILSRCMSIRTNNMRPHVRRLERRDFPVWEVAKLQLEGVYALNSMDSAAREHRIVDMPLKDGM